MEQDPILSLKLKSGYRDPVKLKGKESVFVGRESELNRLAYIVGKRKSGAVLLSGHRGVGKTALAREALRKLPDCKEDKKTVVELSFANLPTNKSSERLSDYDLSYHVLKSIIRGLYFEKKELIEKNKNDKLLIELEEIYKVTYCSELQSSEFNENAVKTISRHENILRNEYDFSESFKHIINLLFSGIFGLFTGASLISITSWAPVMALLVFLIMFLSVKYLLIRKSVIEASEKQEDVAQVARGTWSKSYDLSPVSLEIKLVNLLNKMGEKERLIFIIDELDKTDVEAVAVGKSKENYEETMDNFEDILKVNPVLKVVKSFKNLFTLTSAIFIFVTGEDFYVKLQDEINESPYSPHHTLFTDRIFIHSLNYCDMEDLIDQIFKSSERKDKKTYEKFKNYLCWETKNHVFDLHLLLEELIKYDDQGDARINLYLSGIDVEGKSFRGNIERNWVQMAALQKFLGVIYDSEKAPVIRKEKYNEVLYFVLWKVLNILLNKKSILIKNKEYLSIFESNQFLSNEIEKLTSSEKKDLEGAIERLLLRLEKHKVVELKYDEDDVNFIRYDNFDYPGPEICSITELLNYEEDFIDLMESVKEMRKNLLESKPEVFESHESNFSKMLPIYGKIKQKKPREEKRSDILNYTKMLGDIKGNLPRELFENISDNYAKEQGLIKYEIHELKNIAGSLKGRQELVSKFKRFFDLLEQGSNDVIYSIFSKPNYDDAFQIVGFDLPPEIQDVYYECGANKIVKTLDLLKSWRKKNLYVGNKQLTILNIIYSESLNNYKTVAGWKYTELGQFFKHVQKVEGRYLDSQPERWKESY